MFRKVRWLVALLAAGGVLWLGLAAQAADDKATANDVIADAMAAYRMAEFGRANKAPEALVAAASMLKALDKVKLREMEEPPPDEDGKKTEKTPSFAQQAKDLFEEASALGVELKMDAVIEPLIKAARARNIGNRAVIGGPRTINRTIGPNGTQVFHFNFEPEKPGSFGFKASFPMKISVVRSDSAGAVIGDGVTAAGHLVHVFGKAAPGKKSVPVTVRIHNESKQAGTFLLLVN
jgi:hypothetical protein